MQGGNFCETIVALNKHAEGGKDSHSVMERLHVLGNLKIKKTTREELIGYTGLEVQIIVGLYF